MPKRKVATSTKLSNHTLLNFFSGTPADAENASSLSLSSSEHSKGTISALKHNAAKPVESVLGTRPENAVFIDDSSEDEVDVHRVPTSKKSRMNEAGPSTPQSGL